MPRLQETKSIRDNPCTGTRNTLKEHLYAETYTKCNTDAQNVETELAYFKHKIIGSRVEC